MRTCSATLAGLVSTVTPGRSAAIALSSAMILPAGASSTSWDEAGVELGAVAADQMHGGGIADSVAQHAERAPGDQRDGGGGQVGQRRRAAAASGSGRASAGLLTIGARVPSKSQVTSSRGVRGDRVERAHAGRPEARTVDLRVLAVADEQTHRQIQPLADVGRRGPPGQPGQQVGQPDIRDDARDVVLVLGRFAVTHGAGEHRVHQLADVINLAGRRRVGEHERAGHGLGQQRIALHRPVELADHEVEPLIRRAAGQRGAVGLGVDALELPAERRHQQVHLRREVAVQRADRDIGAFGDRTHLNCLVAALRGDGQGGVQDALAALTLGFGSEFGLGQYGHVHHLTRSRVRPRSRVGVCWL